MGHSSHVAENAEVMAIEKLDAVALGSLFG
jgi:hypothetical protein